MMNRRQFLSAAAAGAAMFVRAPKAFAARYDMIIRGGRVIDPSVRLDAIRDVAISGGRIVAVGRRSRHHRRARQAGSPWSTRYPHPYRALRGGTRPCAARRRDRVNRCGIARGRSHRRDDCRRAIGAATGPRADQHWVRRHPARRRHDGPQTRRCGHLVGADLPRFGRENRLFEQNATKRAKKRDWMAEEIGLLDCA
jgi:hypothetical protein